MNGSQCWAPLVVNETLIAPVARERDEAQLSEYSTS